MASTEFGRNSDTTLVCQTDDLPPRYLVLTELRMIHLCFKALLRNSVTVTKAAKRFSIVQERSAPSRCGVAGWGIFYVDVRE